MKKILLISLLILWKVSLYGQETLEEVLNKYNHKKVPYIAVTELKNLQQKNKVVILDSRELVEFKVSHIEGAILVGYDHFRLSSLPDNVDKKTPIVVYCTLGVRSEVIANQLVENGYTDVKNLYGGISEWKNKDYIVIDSIQRMTENIHVYSKKWGKWLTKGNPIF
ncbi:rhodanese-like domain-containing protein [Flavobacteriaceae bacterium]|jgi:rhodanese-related sulfurtransferase|nr:rhodanese-like domain-containing protein [Flavobacteriaceae bacterium]